MSITSNQALRKVPEITLLFWLVKLLTTAMGEATSDFLVFRYNPYLAVLAGGIVLMIVLIIQFGSKCYNAWSYWTSVAMVAVFGTMAADSLHIQLHVPYIISTIFFAIILIIVFRLWYKSEHNLSIHSINTRRRETFYWATVLATFALGTAAGDLTATTIGIGYFSSALLFAGLIALIASGYYLFKLNEIFCFWLAYILTRPLGASLADWMGKAKSVGGLGWGDGHVAIILTIIIIGFVSYLAISHRDDKTYRARIV